MKSYWIESKKAKKYDSLKENIDTDICIIGGGLTGITTAYYLNQYKIRNVILEKDRICSRTTGHSTAKITSQHGLFYKYLIDSKGKEFAKKYYEANEEAIKNIENIIKQENIECGLEKQSAYVFAQTLEGMQNIKDEIEAVKQIGGNVNLVEAQDIAINQIKKEEANPIKALIAMEFPNQAQFNVYQYGTELAEICNNRQTKIYEKSKVIGMSEAEKGYEIYLENGSIVKTKYVVIATKYPIIDIPGYHFIKMYQETANVIMVDPKDKVFEGMYINEESPTISLRKVKEKDKDYLIVAGFEHKTGAKIDLSNSYEYLIKVAKSLYPKSEIKYQWNTEDCIPLDKIPYIGEFSNNMEHVYVGTGYKEWGMTTSNIAANIIVDKIMEKDNKYADIFAATRLEPIKNRKELGNMIKESVQSIIINKLKSPKESIEQLQENEGGIVEINGEKIGAYKNKKGEIFKVKPVCQHLGCELSWNNLDKTWDCPCHGSRYDYKGNLIYGPSVKNLEKIP